jgi:hypothetical protein
LQKDSIFSCVAFVERIISGRIAKGSQVAKRHIANETQYERTQSAASSHYQKYALPKERVNKGRITTSSSIALPKEHVTKQFILQLVRATKGTLYQRQILPKGCITIGSLRSKARIAIHALPKVRIA